MLKGNRGFTLVELLAAMVILGLLTIIAAPNITAILTNTKTSIYKDDAKKMVSLAKYKLKGDTAVKSKISSGCVTLKISYLGIGEFKNPPYGDEYDKNNSYVEIKKSGSTYTYTVQILSVNGGKLTGIQRTLSTGIDNANIESLTSAPATSCSSANTFS